MKNLFLVFVAFVFSINANAQKNQNAHFSYQFSVDFMGTTVFSRTEELFYNGNESVYVIYDKDLKSPETTINTSDKKGSNAELTFKSNSDGKDIIIYKDYRKRVMSLRDETLAGKKCIVNDSIPRFDWKFENEKKKIGIFDCQKATTTFRCAKYTVWFTTDIPLNIGPWKLSGLPGLIVEANNEKSGGKYSLVTAEYPVSQLKYTVAPPKTNDVVYSYHNFAILQIKEAEKQKMFRIASSDDNSDPMVIDTSAECYDNHEN
jgi:GLPGLI family protein